MAYTIGLVADDAKAMVKLRKLLSQFDSSISYTLTADQVFQSRPLHPSLWVVISENAADIFDHLNSWSLAPVFLADNLPDEAHNTHYQQWRNGLYKKLLKVIEELPADTEKTLPVSIEAIDSQGFKDLWVLAASLGGPEAVRVFLAHIHPDLPVSFVYAQHIENNFDKMLPSVVGKNSRFKVNYANDGDMLKRGTVTVYSSHTLTQVDNRGRIHVLSGQTWQKPYTPNINQAIDNVADHFKQKMGVIIFSGMCDDGATASIALAEKNIPLWAQSPSECICSAMPEAVINKHKVSFVGTAEELAQQLNRRYGKC